MRKYVLLTALLASACFTPKPVPVDRTAEYLATCGFIWQSELGRTIDTSGMDTCLTMARGGKTGPQIADWVRTQPEYASHQIALQRVPHESGWLALDRDNHIVTESGAKWRGVGASDFLLFKRYIDGEDISAVLSQRRDLGFGYLRVFGMFDGALGVLHVYSPDYYVKLDTFLNLVATYGMRVEFVVFADAQRAMPTGQQEHLLVVASVLNQHWNALGELANEYLQNGVSPLLFTKPIGRTLWSRGSNCCGDDGFVAPAWDYITHHAARDDQWPRKSECRPIRDASGRDCLEDEPIGASANNQPGRRSNVVADFAQSGANFGLVTSGALFHSDGGITSVLLEGAEVVLARAFIKGLTFAPVAAITAPYQRGDNCGDCDAIGTMPLQQLDAHELRTFCKLVADTEYCVVIRGDRGIVTRNGWTVVEEVLPGVVRLKR